MKKRVLGMIAAVMAAVSAFAFTACGGNTDTEKDILVVCREAASGTREAFDKYVGLSAQDITSDKEEFSSTGNVREKVASTKTAIGYVSLASVDTSVKAVKIENVEPTQENVRSGEYKIQRPFLLLTSTSVTLSAAAKDFFDYCMSKTAESVITAEKGITTSDFSTRPEYTVPTTALSGTVVLKGSTSMEDIIKKLADAYIALCGDKVSAVNFTFDFPGSGGGRTATTEDTTGNVIGLASSSSPNAAYTENTLCLDAVAVIVNKENDAVTNLTKEQLKGIYTGAIKKFSELK